MLSKKIKRERAGTPWKASRPLTAPESAASVLPFSEPVQGMSSTIRKWLRVIRAENDTREVKNEWIRMES